VAAVSATPATTSTLTLSDGRRLAYAVSGPAGGVPVLHHHGTPGCLLQPRAVQRACAERGLRLLTYTRAGAEGSTRNPGRSVADVVPDMAELLDHLDAPRAIVIGESGGGPHALATAAGLPDRVVGAASVAGVMPGGAEGFLDGMGESNVEEVGLAVEGEALLRPWIEREAAAMREADAAGMVAQLATVLPDIDRTVLVDPTVGVDLVDRMRGGVQVVDGWVDDDLAFTRDWGFDLADIRVPVGVWQGSADLMVPFHHGQWLASHIPGARAHLEQGEGHFSIAVARVGDVLDELAAGL
jgi:pimeloyl-ACP methyl ester carboxylesterase